MANDPNSGDGYAQVYIADSGMTAYLTVYGPKLKTGRVVLIQDALAALKEAGVVEGIEISDVAEALKSENWSRPFLIARGTPAKDGQDGRLEYVVSIPDEGSRPVELEDGRVDFRNLNLYTSVSQGQLLVLRTPPIPGIPGITVTGRSVMPKVGRNFPLPRGRNTVTNEDQTELHSAIDGHLTIIDGKMSVHTTLEISGHVDFSTGNIDYIGNVTIKGNITSGFTVKAGGDIEIKGVIEGATVVAKGNIIVKNGIAGGNKALVQAGGNLYARFVENSRVEVEGDVLVTEAIIQSSVKATNSIKMGERKGVIVGGTLQAGEEISARVIGSSLSTQTILEVGLNPQLREERRLLNQNYQEKKRAFDNINQYIQAYQKTNVAPENLTNKRKIALAKLLSEYKGLKAELEELTQRRQEIEGELSRLQKGRVKVQDVVYPGVQITIGQAQYNVNDPIRFAMFTLKEGDIKIEPLRR